MANEQRASLVIQLVDKVSSGLQSLNTGIGNILGKLNQYKLAIGAIAGGVAAAGATIWGLVKQAMESEKAVNILNVALAASGQKVSAVAPQLQQFAKDLQKITTFSDEAVLSSMALSTSFGLTGEQLKTATKAILDFSVRMGTDLQSATLLVNKALNGNSTMLQKLGIDLNLAKGETATFAQVIEGLQKVSAGAAEGELSSLDGKIKNLKESFGETQESLGNLLMPVIEIFVDWMRKALEVVNSLLDTKQTFASWAVAVADAFLRVFEVMTEYLFRPLDRLIELFNLDGAGFEKLSTTINGGIDQIREKLKLWAQEHENTNQKKKNSDEKYLKFQRTAQIKEVQEEKKIKEVQHDAHIKEWEAFKKRKQDERDATKNALDYISTLQTAKNKEWRAIGKASAIASATINAHETITKTMASVPYPLNIPLAAAAAVAAFAQVAAIQGVQLAEGGIVMPRPGGTLATIGEAGSAEAVIPLKDGTGESMLGNTVININAGTIVADQMAVEEFAKQIDRELFRLGRNNMRVSNA